MVFVVVQVFLGLGMRYGLFAVALAMPMAGFRLKYVKLRRKHELVVALGYTAAVAMFSVAHVAGQLAASAIL